VGKLRLFPCLLWELLKFSVRFADTVASKNYILEVHMKTSLLKISSRAVALLLLINVTSYVSSCTKPSQKKEASNKTEVASNMDLVPPPAPSSPIVPSPLVDQSRDLAEILENGTLTEEDCNRYFKGEHDRETTLRCGKWMFFYGHLEVPGAPAKIIDMMRENAPKTVGKSLEQYGLITDSSSKTGLPVGMADGPDMTGGVPTYTFTCAACHFGKITDGRYVVGSPNHEFEFGKLTLTIASLPELAVQPNKKLPAEVKDFLSPIADEFFGKGGSRFAAIAASISLLPSVVITKISPPNDEAKLALVVSPAGVMDPYAAPSLDDKVAIPVRMSPLWGIDQKAMTAAGSKHGAMLGSNGGAPDLQHIMRTSATISGKIRALPLGENYDEAKVLPLVEYVLSLNPPVTERKSDPVKVAAGGKLFGQKCFSCHNGPGYAGTRVFDPKEIGTDPNIIDLADPEKTGKAIFDVLTPSEVTKGIRARRLSAVWSMTRLFHNGNSNSLAEVFCLNGPRPENKRSGYSSAGHMFTCDGLSKDEKNSLIYFLETL
jgi:hypothetical protein